MCQMDKKELIECIREINKGATAEFLDGFSQEDLTEYLEHLMDLDLADATAAN